MPADILEQLRALRDSVAESLKKDPHYLTLVALDKSIAEISGVLRASGQEVPAAPAPLHLDAPAVSSTLAGPAKVPAPEPKPAASEGGAEKPKLGKARPAVEVVEDAPVAAEPITVPPSVPADSSAEYEYADDWGRASGYVPMAAKPGAAQYQPSIAVKFGKLPNKVDLRSLMTPIEDQGQTLSCVASAVASAYEFWLKKATKQDHRISRLFVYYNARWRDGSQDEDDGSVIQHAMDGLASFGACSDRLWPFDEARVLQRPGTDAYRDAAPFRVQDMQQVPLKLETWKQALAEGKPIVFGIALFDSFDACSENGGVVPMPTPGDVARATHSGHSMCAVGYSDAEKVFIVRNSWGPDWGDGGYCYMPYSYLLNPKFNDADCWVFVPKMPAQPPREVWSDNSDPVTNGGRGVDFAIAPYSIEDYAAVPVDLFADVRQPFNETISDGYAKHASHVGTSAWSELESTDARPHIAPGAVPVEPTPAETEAWGKYKRLFGAESPAPAHAETGD